ncbi:hypothetical protein AMK17_25680 [Streptomyces sp. CB00072]|nr:hypothetical protein AMK17_25680 [Streptomyces sp. CB00072]
MSSFCLATSYDNVEVTDRFEGRALGSIHLVLGKAASQRKVFALCDLQCLSEQGDLLVVRLSLLSQAGAQRSYGGRSR